MRLFNELNAMGDTVEQPTQTDPTTDWKAQELTKAQKLLAEQDKVFQEKGGHAKFGVINDVDQSDNRLKSGKLDEYFGANQWKLSTAFQASNFKTFGMSRLITAGDYAIKGLELQAQFEDKTFVYRFSNKAGLEILKKQASGQNSFICSIEKAYMTKEKDGKPAEQVYRIAVAGIN
jgi:hypothetical protein